MKLDPWTAETKSLFAETDFGSKGAIAKIKVTRFVEKPSLAGSLSGDIFPIIDIQIIFDGKTMTKGSYVYLSKGSDWEKVGADPKMVYTRIGKAMTEGYETGHRIMKIIDELHTRLDMESPGDKRKKEEKERYENKVSRAKEIVSKVKNPNELMTSKEISEWRIRYNNIMNEGGEGYIPHKISRESYYEALSFLESIEKDDSK